MRRRRFQLGQPTIELNVIPLIDVVFFLLVFYVISTAFTSEASVVVQRPASSQTHQDPTASVLVAVTSDGHVVVAGRSVARAEIMATVAGELRRLGISRVIVVADRTLATGDLLTVMDACTAGGGSPVEIAATAGAVDPGMER